MMAVAVAVEAATIGYARSAPVLRDVKITLERGESLAVLGGNGAGKTALLHWIAGVLPRAKGLCRVDGRAIESPRDAVAAGVGLVVQDPDDQLLGATVEGDVEIGPKNQRLSDAEVSERVARALATVGLSALAGREIESLSFGERKRACLAGVLAMRPSLLLLDEPTAGLDPVGELAFAATLRSLAERGTTLVVATHAVDLVPHFATRVLVLGEGRILDDRPCRDALARADLLARARVRRPWPAELWAEAPALPRYEGDVPLTMKEAVSCLTPAY